MALMKSLIAIKLLIKIKHIKIKSFCLKCKEDTENINPRVSQTSDNRAMILSKHAECGSKKSRFIKN